MIKLLYIPSGELIKFTQGPNSLALSTTEIMVKCVKANGKISLSHKALMPSVEGEEVAVTTEGVTNNYEQSLWCFLWKDSINNVVKHFCKAYTEIDTKISHGIPIDIELSESEFEIIYE